MESSDQPVAPVDVHAPFTRAERMKQLAEIDKDIASILELTGKAIQSLGKQTDASSFTSMKNENGKPVGPLTADEQTQAFQDNMEQFLTTLHSVDVRLKRQIFGLEEAGIIATTKEKPKNDENGGLKPTLEPNGLGMVGNLDVGWLNSRSNQVEREMEAELWIKTRKHLESLSGRPGAEGVSGDIDMTGS